MKHESELVTAVNKGFRKWLTIEELRAYVDAERARISKAPEIFLVAFNTQQGFVKHDVSIVKVTKITDETGKLIDLELDVVNDVITDPLKLTASAFQPEAVHPRIPFCRIFSTAKDRDSYHEDIRFISDLGDDYRKAAIEQMRRQMGF